MKNEIKNNKKVRTRCICQWFPFSRNLRKFMIFIFQLLNNIGQDF